MGVSIYLKGYKDKQGRSQLEIKARHRGQHFTQPLFKVSPDDFDATRLRLKPSSSVYTKRNKELSTIKENMYTSWDLYEAGVYSWEEFTRRLKGGKSDSDVLAFVDDVFKSNYKDVTYFGYRNSVMAFRKALGTSSVTFNDFNYTTIINIVRKWKRTLSAASINSYIKNLQTIVNEAHRRGLVDAPFVHHKQYRQKETTRILQTVTSEQFREAIPKVRTLYQFEALTIWLLTFSLRGMYAKDLVNLHKHKLQNEDRSDLDRYVLHKRSKTGEAMDVKYSIEPIEDMLNTLKRAVRHTHKDIADTDIGLRIFTYDSEDSRRHRNIWSVFQQRTRELLGAPLKSSRKTFESISLLLDVSQAIRYRLLGHVDTTVKKHYIDWQWDGLRDKVDEAHSRVLTEFNTVELWTMLKDRYLELTNEEDVLIIEPVQ